MPEALGLPAECLESASRACGRAATPTYFRRSDSLRPFARHLAADF